VEVRPLEIAEVKVLIPKLFRDARGVFSETYNRRTMTEAGIAAEFVQDNQSLSSAQGTVRGLHFQISPRGQGKLVRVIRGAIFDVAVDIRAGSPTYGRHVHATLSDENRIQIWIPPGFAHGFCTLEPNTEVSYKVTDYYAPECDRGLQWDDASLGIEWPVDTGSATLSDKDRKQTAFRDLVPALP